MGSDISFDLHKQHRFTNLNSFIHLRSKSDNMLSKTGLRIRHEYLNPIGIVVISDMRKYCHDI